ncbi:ArgE/DapE family deacylase [Gemmatimonadota bacterium]
MPALRPEEIRVLDQLDVAGMVAFAQELVAIPSVGGAETPAQEAVARLLAEAGLEVDVWELDLPSLRRHPAYSSEIHRDSGLGVVGVLGEDRGGRSLILNGHVDVVPAGDESVWAVPPWSGRVEGGRLHGRGSLDMKGGLACALFAAKAIKESGVRLRGRLILESVIGEEDGGVGTLAAIVRGYRADGAVIMEPTGLALCPAQAGALSFRVTVRGRGAHGCVREEGVSALEKLYPVHRELLALEARRNHFIRDPLFQGPRVPFSLSVGTVRGGDWASSVPEWVTVEGRYGLAPEEDEEEAKADFQRALDAAVEGDPWLRDHPPELEWWGGRFLPARISSSHPLVEKVGGAFLHLTGRPPVLEGVTFGSDMRLLVVDGRTPTLLFGPGDIRRAHSPDESVSVEDLEVTLRTLALAALRFCGCEEHEST